MRFELGDIQSGCNQDEPGSTCRVYINNKLLNVRYNLHVALHTFRSELDRKSRWWIDAICIDQSSIPERNQQVARMREIYEYSEKVVVWLGPSLPHNAVDFDKLKCFVDSMSQREIDPAAHGTLTGAFLKDFNEIWKDFARLMRFFYWERAWVIQELSSSRQIAQVVLQCGLSRITLGQVVKIPAMWNQRDNRDVLFGPELASNDWRNEMEIMKNLRAINIIIHIYTRAKLNGKLPGLILLLARFRTALSTDPRDKIYAALGLSDSRGLIKVDYSLPTGVIYTQTAKWLIETSKSFQILAYCKFPSILSTLPSWVPDWSDPGRLHGRVLHRGDQQTERSIQPRVYAATGRRSKPDVRFEETNQVMVVKGSPFGAVAFVSSPYPSSIEAARHGTSEHMSLRGATWLREWAIFQAKSGEKLPSLFKGGWKYQPNADLEQFEQLIYHDGEPAWWAYILTCAASVIDDAEKHCQIRIGPPFPGSFKETVNILSSNIGLETDTSAYKPNMAFAVSETGLFALVPAETVVGDQLALFQGSETPFIIRRCSSNDKYLLIGECYVHRAMDGQVWKVLKSDGHIQDLRII